MALTYRLAQPSDNPRMQDLVAKITMPGPAEMCFQRQPDFFIGAHAQAEGYQLLTRDAGRYRSYFPGIDLISP